tara:strand:- start:737 stop:853 length:117 start_codon:yes stop_codon:yes gene_type:complete
MLWVNAGNNAKKSYLLIIWSKTIPISKFFVWGSVSKVK